MIENRREILEWYLCAGVDECCDEVPFALQSSQKQSEPSVRPAGQASAAVAAARPATTDLAQASLDARKSARELCSKAASLEELKKLVEDFDGCALKLTAMHTVFGDGSPNARIVFIGEAPGADEDRQGRPFVGRSGHLLDKMLAASGLKREECYITNILPWRPPGHRTPLDSEIAVCLPFLQRQIELIKPDFLFLLGGSAANAVLDCAESISRLRGHWLDYKTSDGQSIQALASFHPAYLLRNSGQKAKAWADMLRLKKQL